MLEKTKGKSGVKWTPKLKKIATGELLDLANAYEPKKRTSLRNIKFSEKDESAKWIGQAHDYTCNLTTAKKISSQMPQKWTAETKAKAKKVLFEMVEKFEKSKAKASDITFDNEIGRARWQKNGSSYSVDIESFI
ncbi:MULTISPECIES: hypothetical protein [unclassified Arcicella]|uniref:hypothetical protein n=1 Tax=unclassified Arcicella TaxID=2644986 RepID=UPI0028602E1B|nr:MULTISPECIES: hypothetical protein [unclassified Arcicella]MDR6564954.1 hypothetical protein [Arcicella sp. BE51]MDR6814744.1 hypothetical protein [Arcicella sp. BE140]MDR6826190.1 hypothetical protein [Arcicella sp. BE139]